MGYKIIPSGDRYAIYDCNQNEGKDEPLATFPTLREAIAGLPTIIDTPLYKNLNNQLEEQ